jgi:RNA polymerase sigma-70 factor, ECF subfamily
MEKEERPMTWDHAISNVLPGGAADLDAAPASASMDSDRFAAFYERSARPLWAYLARVSANPALADDLLQESFVRFLCADHPTDGEVSARRYLFRIATNLLRDYWRRPRAASLEEIPEEMFRTRDHSSECDSKAMLGPALKTMKPRERQLLWLAYAEGYSHREIAEITGLATASIKLLLFRARRKLARLLAPPIAPDGRPR